jgi:hypothetical protein
MYYDFVSKEIFISKEIIKKSTKLFKTIKPILNKKQIKDIENQRVDCLLDFGSKPEDFKIYSNYDFKYWYHVRFFKNNNIFDTTSITKFLELVEEFGETSIFVCLVKRVVECNIKLNYLGLSNYIYFDDLISFLVENKNDIIRLTENSNSSHAPSKLLYDENCVLNWLTSYIKKSI